MAFKMLTGPLFPRLLGPIVIKNPELQNDGGLLDSDFFFVSFFIGMLSLIHI